MLTFEVVGDSELEIHGDAKGLESLMRTLSRVLETKEHEHLMTPAWGGNELGENAQRADAQLINKVTIRIW